MNLKAEIKKFFKGDIEDSAEVLEKYSRDASMFEIAPKLVVFPKDNADIQELVRFVAKEKKANPDLSITVRSAGTDMSGGPLGSSIVIDVMRYMNKIGEIRRIPEIEIIPLFPGAKSVEISGEAIVEPGVFYRDFEKEAEKQNLLLPCYTASKSINALGGMVGNNSGGELTLRYGKTEDYVKELKIVLSDGHEYTLRPISRRDLYGKIAQKDFEGELYKKLNDLYEKKRTAIENARPKVSKNSAGYNVWNLWRTAERTTEEFFNPAQLIIGSQGTLGIVTEITLRLIEPKPHKALTVLFLNSLDPIEEVTKAVSEFLKKTLNVKDAKVIKVTKVGEGWETEVEVYEESSFIKALGLPTRVQDRNFYNVKLNDSLEIESYGRKESSTSE